MLTILLDSKRHRNVDTKRSARAPFEGCIVHHWVWLLCRSHLSRSHLVWYKRSIEAAFPTGYCCISLSDSRLKDWIDGLRWLWRMLQIYPEHCCFLSTSVGKYTQQHKLFLILSQGLGCSWRPGGKFFFFNLVAFSFKLLYNKGRDGSSLYFLSNYKSSSLRA